MNLSYHVIALLAGIAVAVLTLLGAVAVGPYGRRGIRLSLGTISFAAFLGTAYWFTIYLGYIQERRAIEVSLSELRAQALSPGSPLGCLERASEVLETACAQAIFATPEALAAANVYTASRLDLLGTIARYSGPRTAQFDDAVVSLRISLEQDPFGLTAKVLMLRYGCSVDRCDAIRMFHEPARLWDNIRRKTFDANLASHAVSWRQSVPASQPPVNSPAAPTAPAETRAPIPEKYTLPSAASIPPVSIMDEEPAERPGPSTAPTKDRPPVTGQLGTTSPRDDQMPAAAPSAPPRSSEKQAAPRREKTRPNAPLSISPPQ